MRTDNQQLLPGVLLADRVAVCADTRLLDRKSRCSCCVAARCCHGCGICCATALRRPRALLLLVWQAHDRTPSPCGVLLKLHGMQCNTHAPSSIATTREYFFTVRTVDPQGGFGVLSLVCHGVRLLLAACKPTWARVTCGLTSH